MNKSLYACAEHIETVLDMYIDDHETPPEFRKIEHTHSLSTTCELCDEPAIYIVGTNDRTQNTQNLSTIVDNLYE